MRENPSGHSLADQFLLDMRKKWEDYKFIFKRRVCAETRLRVNKNHRYIALKNMIEGAPE